MYVLSLGTAVVSWSSKRQLTVSISTTEVEYRAAAAATAQESTWLMQLMRNLHQTIDYAVPLHCYNQSAIHLAKNLQFHARTKHLKVHYHFVREKVLQGEIEMCHTKTKDQVAGLFTKGLNATTFAKFRKQLGITTMEKLRENQSRGGVLKVKHRLSFSL